VDNKKIIEEVAKAPAEALDKTIVGTEYVAKAIGEQKTVKKAKEYWHILGPGLTTGASDDDPSGIGTYSQTGAKYGFQLLWLSLFTFPLMAIVQEMCARIGLVTGRGLASNIRMHFPKWVLYVCTILLFAANTFNIGADLGAMAKATELLWPQIGFTTLIIAFTLICLFLQVFSTYQKYAKFLKWLALVLLAYIFSTLLIKGLDWNSILSHTIKPSITFSKDQIILICGILGTTISPYLFFWQTSQEVEEDILAGKTNIEMRQNIICDKDVSDMRVDVWSGMVLSNIVMFFIITACAATLNAAGIMNINSAAEAASALQPLAGDSAYLLFAIGIIGTGLLAVPVLAGSASYAISESFGWREGLNKNLRQAYAFYGVIIISMLAGLGINFVGLDPMKALIYSAVGNGLVAPVVLILIVLIASNTKLMGKRKNSKFTTTLGWIITGIMVVAGIATLYSLFA